MMTRRMALALLPLLAWRTIDPALAQSALRIVATTGMIADAARRIGGSAVTVNALMGPGVDPHGYRQTRSDIAAMAGADLVLWHGLFLEAQLERFLHGLAQRRPVVAVAEILPRALLRVHQDYKDRFDPHVWMAPRLWRQVCEGLLESLLRLRPDLAGTFRSNAAPYLAEIDAVDTYARGVLASIPSERRLLVSAHDAFGYFGREYGFQVEGIQGISTESEAGLLRIRQLVDLIVARRVGAIFVESSVSDRNIRALIEGAAAKGHAVRLGGELFSDAMGKAGSYEGTYPGMIDHNVTTIARALGGDAPERGMSGRLGLA